LAAAGEVGPDENGERGGRSDAGAVVGNGAQNVRQTSKAWSSNLSGTTANWVLCEMQVLRPPSLWTQQR